VALAQMVEPQAVNLVVTGSNPVGHPRAPCQLDQVRRFRVETQHKSYKRRAWAYCMPPKAFEVAECSCGNQDTQWSEFEDRLWCDRCQKDFIPEHYGILGGPLPIHLAEMMGIRFDRVIIETGEVERFNSGTLTWEKEKPRESGNAGHPTGEA